MKIAWKRRFSDDNISTKWNLLAFRRKEPSRAKTVSGNSSMEQGKDFLSTWLPKRGCQTHRREEREFQMKDRALNLADQGNQENAEKTISI
jgi:hypothetical protein